MSWTHFSYCVLGGQLAVDEQVGDLEVGRLFGQVLDGVAAVAEDPVVAVEERDRARQAAVWRKAGS